MRSENRYDERIIAGLVAPGSRVLDLGCGDGELMALLVRTRQARVEGVELDDEAIFRCVAKGLSVTHGDLDEGLADYPTGSFDYVILNQSLQQVKRVDFVIEEALRVGRQVIVAFPNFLHWQARCQMFFAGKVPVTPSLPYKWYSTPNLHFLSIADFWDFTREKKIRVVENMNLGAGMVIPILPNLFARTGIFVLGR